jgi:hypothetical protein
VNDLRSFRGFRRTAKRASQWGRSQKLAAPLLLSGLAGSLFHKVRQHPCRRGTEEAITSSDHHQRNAVTSSQAFHAQNAQSVPLEIVRNYMLGHVAPSEKNDHVAAVCRNASVCQYRSGANAAWLNIIAAGIVSAGTVPLLTALALDGWSSHARALLLLPCIAIPLSVALHMVGRFILREKKI